MKSWFFFYVMTTPLFIVSYNSEVELSGIVADASGEPIEAADVIVYERDKMIQRVMTDQEGQWAMKIVKAKFQLLEVRAKGYQTVEMPLSYIKENVQFEFLMEPTTDTTTIQMIHEPKRKIDPNNVIQLVIKILDVVTPPKR